MIKKATLLILLMISAAGFSQRMFTNDKSFDIFHNYTRWGIQLDGLLYFPATYDDPNQYSFQSQLALGYKFGFVYNFSLSNHVGFRVGALTGQVPAINTYFILKKEDIDAQTDYYHREGARYSPFFSSFSFPLLLEYRIFAIDRYIINLDAGAQIERTGSKIILEQYKNYFTTTVANPGSWDVDLVFKIGWYYQFKRLMMQTNLVYKHRLVNQYEGTYSFTNLKNNPDITGIYIQKGDYIGLSFDFFFHKRSRDVDMGCRTNTNSKQVEKRRRISERAKKKIRKRQEKAKRKADKKMRKKAKKRKKARKLKW